MATLFIPVGRHTFTLGVHPKPKEWKWLLDGWTIGFGDEVVAEHISFNLGPLSVGWWRKT